ncbi:TPA: hypothetical protein I7114_15840 [Vibrio vulnificus]|uniref:ankyrin repeat domain-containing protein n=1 Tax=Vibrio vulnificus TaxID=672 RepID=UPI0019D47F4B|nr:ankyrin repeat domain-containing protein [Vibrio vulnificus]MBN8105220.1 ankyrin repeat domain-containing protein [Vibrio vulnificus]HAS6068193.1 hypothetical protein [Vibrio vulnificus]
MSITSIVRSRCVYTLALVMWVTLLGCQSTSNDKKLQSVASVPIEHRFDALTQAFEASRVNYSSDDFIYQAQLLELAMMSWQGGRGLNQAQLDTLNRYAVELGDIRTSDVLIRQGASVLPSQLVSAIRSGNSSRLKHYLKGAPVQKQGEPSPLTTAIQKGRVDMVKAILNAGYDPDGLALGHYDPMMVPLYVACRYGNDPQIVKLLLDAGAKASVKDAMSFALDNPEGAEIVKLLSSTNSSPTRQELDRSLLAAIKSGQVDGADEFIHLGANPHRVKSELCQILPSNVNVVEFLYAWCGDSAAQFTESALQSIYNGDDKLLSALLAAGVSPYDKVMYKPYSMETTLGCVGILSAEPVMTRAFLFAGFSPNALCFDAPVLEVIERRQELCRDDDCFSRHESIQKSLVSMGATLESDDSLLNFENLIKVAVTAGTGALVSSSGIDAYHGAEIFSATLNDVWIDGQGNSLSKLAERYAAGDFSIQDPQLRSLMNQTQHFKSKQKQVEATLLRQSKMEEERKRQSAYEEKKQAQRNQQDQMHARKDNMKVLEREQMLAQQQAEKARREEAEKEARKQRELAKQREAQARQQEEQAYLDKLKVGGRFAAKACYGDVHIGGVLPKVRPKVVSCIDVYYKATCPSTVRSERGVLTNFVSMGTGCFGDTDKLSSNLGCDPKDLRVVVEKVVKCG